MLRIWWALILVALLGAEPALSQEAEEEQFLPRLEVMQANIEKSVKVIREQITANQTAPFIADLYMQLGDLLTQNANAYYYIFMERAKNSDSLDTAAVGKSTPIVNAQKEAAAIYQRVLDTFPDFEKRVEVQHRLTLLYHDLQMDASMKQIGHQLMKEFPKHKQSMQVRVLIGQTVFREGEYEQARTYFIPASKSDFPYERNSAKLQLGLLEIQEERFQRALDYFKEVVTDDTLVEVADEREQFLSGQVVQDNLKREALTSSVRAYTEVYKKKADPLKYYSDIAPTEELFIFAIEKLSARYIFIERYAEAVELLRVLSESMSDPQKIVNIYKDALRLVPLNQRVHLPPDEVQFVIDKFVDWRASYNIDRSTLKAATIFFERQLRDIATRSHDLGKAGDLTDYKREYLEKSDRLYTLYLAVFPRTPYTLKMAINLGDVHYRLGNFLKSGEYYVRAFRGEFGPSKSQPSLLKNAMIALQKDEEESFYDQMRGRGLLISSIHSLFKLDPRLRQTDRPNFLLAKAYYDLGYYRQGLSSLYEFIQKFPKSKLSADAGELILDYFNIRDDLPNLNRWADRLLALKNPNPQFNSRVKAIKLASATRQLDQQILKKGSYDAFSEGRSYLSMAVEMKGTAMADMALSRALNMSKEEGDIDTFLKTAKAMAANDPQKSVVILQSMASEAYRVGRFSEAISYWQEIARLPNADAGAKREAVASALTTAALLRDYPLVAQLSGRGAVELPPGLRTQILGSLDEPVRYSPELLESFLQKDLTDVEFSQLAKNHFSFPQPLRGKVSSLLQAKCKSNPQQQACQWHTLASLSQRAAAFRESIRKTPASFDYMEREAQSFSTLLESFQRLQGTSDPVVAVVVSLRISALYNHFADFLGRVAQKAPEVAELLNSKIDESRKVAQQVLRGCRDIISQSGLVSPVNAYCNAGKEPSLVQATRWPEGSLARQPSSKRPARNKDVLDAQKSIFKSEGDDSAEHLLELSYQYYKSGHWPQAVASASHGISQFGSQEGAFKEILGCSLGEMNFLNEANYHLDQAEPRYSLQRQCQSKIRQKLRSL